MNKITGKLLDIKQDGINDIYHILVDKDYYISIDPSILNKKYSTLNISSNELNLFRNKTTPVLALSSPISIELYPGQLGTKLNGKDFAVQLAAQPIKPKTIDNSNVNPPKDKQLNTDASPADSNTSHQWPDLPPVSNFTPIPCLLEPGFTRIGYAQFDNPINYVEQSRTSGIISVPVMRQSSTLKAGLGKAYESYTISYLANGPDEIKRSVQEVFEQISLNPFTTVDGDLFGPNKPIKHNAIAIRNFSISTVDNLPGAVAVNITFDPFLWHWYLPFAIGVKKDRFTFDDAICWPLVKIWTKSRERSIYDGYPFSGKMSLAFPSDSTVDQLSNILESNTNYTSTDINSLQALKSILSGGQVLSRNVKKLEYPFIGPNKPTIVFIKVSSKTLWNELTPYTGMGSENYIGLVRWDKIKTNNLVDDGALLPSSSTIQLDALNQKIDPNSPLDISKIPQLGLLEIPKNYQGPIGNNQDEIANPWNYFAIALQVDPKNSSQLSAKIDRLIATQNRNQTVDFKSVTEKLNNLSFESNTTTIFDSNVESDIVIQRISGSRGHKLAVTSGQENPLPIHTYMGGIDATFVVEGTCFGTKAKTTLEQLKEEFDSRAISTKYNKLTTIGKEAGNRGSGAAFMKVKNEIFQLLGVNFVLPITISFQSIDGQPDAWGFSLTFLEFDPKLKASEQIRFLPTTWESVGKVYEYGYQSTNSNPILDRAKEYFSLEGSLAQEEVYPDMDLPSIAELNLWVATLKEIGIAWNNLGTNTDPAKLINQVKQSKSFSNPKVASQLIDWTADFFLNYSKPISKWNAEPLVTKRESISRVDPDFYIYYEPENSWEAVLDGVSEELMGKPNKLRAEGRKSDDPDKPYISPMRFYDTHHNTIHTYDATWFAANPHVYDVEKQTNDAHANMEPKEHADKVKGLYEDGRVSFEATKGNWWSRGYTGVENKETKNIEFSAEQEAALYSDSQTVSSPHNPSDSAKTAELPDFSQYFDIGWRRKFLISCANILPAKPFGKNNLNWTSTGNDFFFRPDTILTNIDEYKAAFINTGSFLEASFGFGGQSSVFSEDQNVTFSDLEILMKGIVKGYDGIENSSSLTLDEASNLTGNDHPWLFRSAYYSGVSSFYNSSSTNESFQTGSSSQEIILNNINYICSNYNNIDPNIIIAVFNLRDGFGTIKRPSGVIGDWKPSFASTITNYPQSINLFCGTYSINMGRFGNIPSIALLATELQLADGYDQYLDPVSHDLTKDAIDRLTKSASDAVSSGRTTLQAGAAIQNALNSFGTAGKMVDAYFTYYIQTCRSLGSCLFSGYASKSDPYFNPLAQIIFLDLSDDKSTISLGNFTPTGSPAVIDATRKQIETIPEIATRGQSTFDPNAISSATQVGLVSRFRAALSPHTEGAIYGSLVDLRKYSAYHRLVRAYPSFQILLINEGWYWASGNKKLWDQFYTRTGVSSIEIFKTRKQPGGTCKITFSNMFYYITAYNQMEVLQQELAVRNNKRLGDFVSPGTGNALKKVGDLFNEFLMKNVPDEVKEIYRNNHLKQLALSSGTRIQVRMGWGSDASQLHTTFNGMVMEAPVDDCYVQLICVSDGYELEKPATTNLSKSGNSYAYADSGALGSGKDPSNIVTEALIACSLGDNLFQGNFRDWSSGVSHFGDIYFNQFQTGNFTHSAAEVQINIYSSNPTTLEQGISQIRNYNIFAGLTNWDKDKNLFGVEVQEATPWKVMEVCRRACPDFVASSETFANRSTAFFGKWWWPYNYSYDPSILENYKVPLAKAQSSVDKYIAKNADKFGSNKDNATTNLPESIKKLLSPSQISKITNYKMHVIDNESSNSNFQLPEQAYTHTFTTEHFVSFGDEINPYQSGLKFIEQNDRIINTLELPGTDLVSIFDAVDTSQNTNISKTKIEDKVSPNLVGDALTDVKNLVPYLKWKTYLQGYFAHSGINLLSNNIVADGTDVYTDAIGMHQGNWYVGPSSVSKTITYSIDTAISPSMRKTAMVDTGLLITGGQQGAKPLADLAGKALDFVLAGLIPASEYIEETPTTPAVNNAVVAFLVDSAKDMYQGWFTITGQPSIKPRDFILLKDLKIELSGPLFVKEVVHKMDSEVGFITMISPDAVAMPTDSLFGQQMILSLATGTLSRTTAWMFAKGTWATIKYLMTGEDSKVAKYLTTEALAKYNKLLEVGEKSKPAVLGKIKSQLISGLEGQLKTLNTALESADGNAVTKIGAKIADVQKAIDDINSQSTIDGVFRIARSKGLNIDSVSLTTDPILGEQIAFEAHLQAESANEIALELEGKTTSLTPEELKSVVSARANAKRTKWINSRLTKANEIIAQDAGLSDTLIKAKKLVTQINNLDISGKLSPAEEDLLRELNDTVAKLSEADVTTDITSFSGKLRKIISGSSNKFGSLASVLEEGKGLKFGARFGEAFTHGLKEATTLPVGIVSAINNFSRNLVGKSVKRSAKGVFYLPSSEISARLKTRDVWKAFTTAADERDTTELFKITRNIKDIETGIETTQEEVITAGKVVNLIKKESPAKLIKTFKEVKNGVMLLSNSNPFTGVIYDTAVILLGDSLVGGINARLRARQCVKIFPLKAGRSEFTAGIRGHQGAVIGDHPGWADEFLFGLIDGKTFIPEGYENWRGYYTLIMGAIGFEMPETGNHSIDDRWIEEFNNLNGESNNQDGSK